MQILSFENMVFILLSGESMFSDFYWFKQVSKAQYLILNNFSIPDICVSLDFSQNVKFSLFALDIAENSVTVLRAYCFISQTDLRTLNLSENKVRTIEKFTFFNLSGLRVLDLTCNELTYLQFKTIIWV